jgi:thiosulfate/3-mercaptopyruvate sulfurtransferase
VNLRLPTLLLALSALSGQTAPDPWTAADLIQPAQLAARLQSQTAAKPPVFYVGFGVLYRGKHIPGAEFAGPGNKQEGLQALREAALKHRRTEEIVLYCGCCPWDHCPNLRPAFQMLHDLGFKRVRVLALPIGFSKDWVEKGYPFESGY